MKKTENVILIDRARTQNFIDEMHMYTANALLRNLYITVTETDMMLAPSYDDKSVITSNDKCVTYIGNEINVRNLKYVDCWASQCRTLGTSIAEPFITVECDSRKNANMTLAATLITLVACSRNGCLFVKSNDVSSFSLNRTRGRKWMDMISFSMTMPIAEVPDYIRFRARCKVDNGVTQFFGSIETEQVTKNINVFL